jgi:hypothetical protein
MAVAPGRNEAGGWVFAEKPSIHYAISAERFT